MNAARECPIFALLARVAEWAARQRQEPMRIAWIDSVNTDAQFLNLLGLVLAQAGHGVDVRSNRRLNFPPPDELTWSHFSLVRPYPQRIDRHPLRYAVAAAYPLDWLRAAAWASRRNEDSVLLTGSLRLPGLDTWAHRKLRAAGLRTLLVAHKPHPGFHADHGPAQAARYRAYHESAARILVMTRYTRDLMADYFALPADRFRVFPHPHFGPLLSRHPTDAGLAARLAAWAGGRPVLSLFSHDKPEDGFDLLLAALPELRRLAPDMRLLVVKSRWAPARRAALAAALAGAGFAPDDLFAHAQPYDYTQLNAFLGASWCVLTPYRWATQSGVIAMAAGAGVPVVTTDVGGLREMILPGVSGEAAAPDDPQALAAACALVLHPNHSDAYHRGVAEACAGPLSPAGAASVIAEAAAGD
jgi:glycosyltransferase involved in cell wall biosynthesis